jgi:hypothetical protein
MDNRHSVILGPSHSFRGDGYVCRCRLVHIAHRCEDNYRFTSLFVPCEHPLADWRHDPQFYTQQITRQMIQTAQDASTTRNARSTKGGYPSTSSHVTVNRGYASKYRNIILRIGAYSLLPGVPWPLSWHQHRKKACTRSCRAFSTTLLSPSTCTKLLMGWTPTWWVLWVHCQTRAQPKH